MNKDSTIHEEEQIKKEKRIKHLCIILFWGALWGILEATVGYILHVLPFRVPTGSILFPIGYYFMQKSYKETKDLKSIFYTSIVAGSIKLINLLIPMTPVIKVINPFACILFEGLAVASVFKFFESKDNPLKYVSALMMSLFWRVGYYMISFAIFIPLGLMKSSSILDKSRFIEFFLVNGFINSIIIYFYSKFTAENIKESKLKYSPALSTSLFCLALFIQWLI